MIFGTESFEIPVKYMLNEVPENTFLSANVTLMNEEELPIIRIEDCCESSDGTWVAFEHKLENSRKVVMINRRDIKGFYLFYVRTAS